MTRTHIPPLLLTLTHCPTARLLPSPINTPNCNELSVSAATADVFNNIREYYKAREGKVQKYIIYIYRYVACMTPILTLTLTTLSLSPFPISLFYF